MSSINALFCHVDDFCQIFEPQWRKQLITQGLKTRQRSKSLCLSEIMTILVMFHQNNYRNFKHYYLEQVCRHFRCRIS
ncbi:putative transposase [Rippkaea orientalis PCC 8801]|uniref:Putative transposase n=1 Tax=Rippkaea orientalis (strain PCC 8801 / RF-1) TaxID=41431 RepID=B7JZA5_RIPO1|nr:transposase [Rippkaea orientalis]ACK67316.1 putative transposase [Rippkaea orientalis PCC 8801]